MRMDEPTDVPKVPTASDVLQHIDERGLIRMLKAYGSLKTKARYVAEAILEARYMFHHFKTTQVNTVNISSLIQQFHSSRKLSLHSFIAIYRLHIVYLYFFKICSKTIKIGIAFKCFFFAAIYIGTYTVH